LGHIALEAGEPVGADQHFEQCLAWAQSIDDHVAMVALLVDSARVARQEPDLPRSRALLRDALRRAQQLGQPLEIVRVLEAVAELLARARPQAAVRLGAAAKHRRDTLGLRAWRREAAASQRLLDDAQGRLGGATLARSINEGAHLDET